MIAIVGGKGGCGKTTTTVGIASALARREAGVVAVDADVDMPDLHTVAGTSDAPGTDAVATGTPLDEALQRSIVHPGVDVLAAPGSSQTLVDVVEKLRSSRKRVLIDTPAGASPDVARPLSIAHRSVLVTTPTRESLSDTAKAAALARALDTPPIGTVVTRSDGSMDPTSLLPCPTLTHVPAVSEPLRNGRVREAYASCLSAVTKRNV